MQWPKAKRQKDNAQKTKDRPSRTILNTGCELRCPGRVAIAFNHPPLLI